MNVRVASGAGYKVKSPTETQECAAYDTSLVPAYVVTVAVG